MASALNLKYCIPIPQRIATVFPALKITTIYNNTDMNNVVIITRTHMSNLHEV